MSSVPATAPARPRAAAAGRPRATGLRQLLPLTPLLLTYLAVGVFAQPGADPVRDERALLAAAGRLLDGALVAGGTDPDPRAYLWHGPGLPALLAPLVALELPLPAIRLIEPVLLGAAVVLFHRLLRLDLQPRTALLGTYAFGLYPPFFSVITALHKEPLALLLVVAAMLAVRRGLVSSARLGLAGAGLALAGLAMVRLEYGWVALASVGVAGLAWRGRRDRPVARRCALVAAVALLGCLPWLAFTHGLTGRPLYWGTSAGLSVFWMSPTLPGENGQWHSPRAVARDPALAPYRPLFRRLASLHPVAADHELRRLAVANVRSDPARYGRNLTANASRLLFLWPMRPPRHPVVVGGCVVFNGLLVAATAWAGSTLRRRRRAPPATLPFVAFAVLAVAVHLPVSATPRMLLPAVPVLVWLVAQAADARAEDEPPRGLEEQGGAPRAHICADAAT